MARKPVTGTYKPKNPEKYIGENPPVYRSSWEYKVFKFFDENKNVSQWASEMIKIIYRNPLTGKLSHYIPDLLVEYVDKNGRRHLELVEVKPLAETVEINLKGKSRQTDFQKMRMIVNHAKWKAAKEWCKMHKIHFRILTEEDIFI